MTHITVCLYKLMYLALENYGGKVFFVLDSVSTTVVIVIRNSWCTLYLTLSATNGDKQAESHCDDGRHGSSSDHEEAR